MKRKTISKQVHFTGRGLHTGSESSITLNPADCGSGIHFKLLNDSEQTTIKAEVSKVYSTKRRTSIGSEEAGIQTVEHLLAALYAKGIDDLNVDIEGIEIPIMDGSAKAFIAAINEAGISEGEKEKEFFVVDEIMKFYHEESGAEYIVTPCDRLDVQVTLRYEQPIKFEQSATLGNLSDFDEYIADSRTYVFGKEIKNLLRDGLIKGGSLENAIVINDGQLSQEEINELANKYNVADVDKALTYDVSQGNELAKHKILDLLGDMSLLGRPIKARIFAMQPGHTANIAFIKFLKAKYLEKRKLKDKPHFDPNAAAIYDLEGIKNFIPHRYPFLFVDRIIELTESKVVGIKNVSYNEHFFMGHFPGNPVFPGVLQLEALAQTGGILVLSQVEDPENYNTYFIKIDKVKFKHLVVPGDTMILKMELLSPIRRGIVHMQGTVYVGNKIVSESELTAQITKRVNDGE